MFGGTTSWDGLADPGGAGGCRALRSGLAHQPTPIGAATPAGPPPAPSVEADHEPDAGPGRAARVLIVEDEQIIAWLLAELVEGLGYEVCGSAADEDEAVRLARETRPDLILMDVRLRAAGDGVRAAEAIRAFQPAVPVVFCTAFAGDPATRARMQAAGAAEVLAKPIMTERLGPLLRRLLGRG